MYITAPDTQSVNPAENKISALKSLGSEGDKKPGFLGQLKRIKEQADEKQQHNLNCDDKDDSDLELNIADTLSSMEEINSNDFMLRKTGTHVMPETGVSNIDTSLAESELESRLELVPKVEVAHVSNPPSEAIVQSIIADSNLAGELIESVAEMTESKPAGDMEMLQGILKSAVSSNLQESDEDQTVKMSISSPGKAEIKDDAEKIRFKNRINASVGDTAKNKEDILGKMITTDHNNSDSKNHADTELKKVIDFEAHRVKASQLPNTVESSKQDAGTNAQVIVDKSQFIEAKPINPGTSLQDNFRTSVKPEEVIEQIVEKAELIRGKNTSEIKMQLKPEFLGKMTIKLVVEEGGLTAKFITDNGHVKNMLESNLNVLKQTLENQGIKVEKTEVNVQLNNGGMSDGHDGNQQDWQHQKYAPQSMNYIEDIDMDLDQELFPQEIESVNYTRTGMMVENSMSLLA